MPRPLFWILLVVVACFGVGPYTTVLWELPWGSDAMKWINECSLTHPEWFEQMFLRKHFIGYRPVAALSYLLNSIVFGFSPFAYRAVDLLLWLTSGASIMYAYRTWTRSPGWGMFAVGLVIWCHPVGEQIVPFLARRSYTLGTTLAMLCLVALAKAVDEGENTNKWPWVALLVFASVLSNEMAYAMVPMLPMLAYHRNPSARAISMKGLLWSLLAIIVAIGLRMAIVGTGGYNVHYYATVGKNSLAWVELREPDRMRSITSALEYLSLPVGADGTHHPISGVWATLFWTMSGIWLMVRGVALPLKHATDDNHRFLGLMVVWFCGTLALVSLSGTWFWRQGFGLLLPAAMFLGAAVDHVAAHPSVRWLEGGVIAAIISAMLVTGPYSGITVERSARLQGGQTIHALAPYLERVPDNTTAYLVLPHPNAQAHQIRVWLHRWNGHRGVDVKLLAQRKGAMDTGAFTLDSEYLNLNMTQMGWARSSIYGVKLPENGKLKLQWLRPAGAHVLAANKYRIISTAVSPRKPPKEKAKKRRPNKSKPNQGKKPVKAKKPAKGNKLGKGDDKKKAGSKPTQPKTAPQP